MVRHCLRVFERPAASEVIGDAGCTQRVIADFRFDAGSAGPPLDHPVSIGLRHAMRPARPLSGRAEQRPVFVVRDAGRGDVFIEVRGCRRRSCSNLWSG